MDKLFKDSPYTPIVLSFETLLPHYQCNNFQTIGCKQPIDLVKTKFYIMKSRGSQPAGLIPFEGCEGLAMGTPIFLDLAMCVFL
jgi:hypothetical protein